MRIQTSRFGIVEFDDQDVINFPEGILGFVHLKQFVLLDDTSDEIFAWLQACQDPNIAFPVLEPELFTDQYEVKLSKSDMQIIGASSGEKFRAFCIVTIPQDPTLMTANLKAPLVINVQKRMGRQCVLADNQLAIREPIFARLQKRVVQNPDRSLKSQDIDCVIPLPVSSTNLGSDLGPT